MLEIKIGPNAYPLFLLLTNVTIIIISCKRKKYAEHNVPPSSLFFRSNSFFLLFLLSRVNLSGLFPVSTDVVKTCPEQDSQCKRCFYKYKKIISLVGWLFDPKKEMKNFAVYIVFYKKDIHVPVAWSIMIIISDILPCFFAPNFVCGKRKLLEIPCHFHRLHSYSQGLYNRGSWTGKKKE